MKQQTTVVYIINSLNVGGAEIGICRLLAGLDRDRYDVTVAVLDGQSTELADQIPSWVRVIRPSSILIQDPRALWRFVRSIREADVIVGSLYHSVIAAKLSGILNPDATVATWRHINQFKTTKRKVVFEWTIRMTDVVLADSEPVSEVLADETRIDDSQIHTVPIAGLDLEEYTPVTHGETNTPVIGTVGRLTEQKNHATTLAVAERLQGSGISFKIAGEGELYEELEREIGKRGLTNVTLRGFVDDIPQFLSGLDIYFQPSLQEGLCISVLEAMATGLPVVGSDVGGIGRNVEHGKSGFLKQPNDIDGFVSAIETLATDSQLREQFGRHGRETVAETFTQEALVSEFEIAVRED